MWSLAKKYNISEFHIDDYERIMKVDGWGLRSRKNVYELLLVDIMTFGRFLWLTNTFVAEMGHFLHLYDPTYDLLSSLVPHIDTAG